ncbi:hypothetical protein [uncultured Corynebacterium sp.]|uniref:hypothetical protein n=1 Tax=uncultured Corynebacterium sp. TaxID=159447 RepID=UPI002598E0CE|nr:hypothetical protein [uncultured Corynebacterium sp.]
MTIPPPPLSCSRTTTTTELLENYNDALATYYSRYGAHPRWSDQLLNRLSAKATEKSKRRFLRDVLVRAGFNLR